MNDLIGSRSSRTLAFCLLIGVLVALTFVPSFVHVAYAQVPERPMLVMGNITLNGNPAPDGLTLYAKIGGRDAGSTTTEDGQYVLQVDAIDGADTRGETINFFLTSLSTSQTATFDNISNGGVLTLPLAFTGTPTTPTVTTTTQVQTTQTSTSGTTSTGTQTTSTQSTVITSSSSSSETSSTGSSQISSTTSAETSSTTSSSATTPSGQKCLIATAAYGSELAPEVQLLRNFRDNSILRTRAGSSFMVAFNAWYYSFSPYIANYLAGHWVERTIMKGVLYPLIGTLILSQRVFAAVGFYPEFAALLSGLLASSLIGAVYLGLPVGLLRARVRRLGDWRVERLLERLLGLMLLGGVAVLIVGEASALPIVLMVSSATVVLSTLFLSAVATSARISKRLQTA